MRPCIGAFKGRSDPLFRRGAVLVVMAVALLLSACQKKDVRKLPEISLPSGLPFVIVQPAPSPVPDPSKRRPYIGVLTGLAAFSGHLVVSGYQGTIFRYSPRMNQWTEEASPVRRDLYGVAQADPETFWIAGDNGVLLESRDGGIHWNAVKTGVAPLFLNAVSFPTPAVGYAVGEQGLILKTVDGGEHWSPVASPTRENLYGVSFSDASTGVISGWHRTLIRTSDGGKSLSLIHLPVQKVSRQEPSFNSVWSRGNHFLVAGDHGFLFDSSDGGKSFQEIETGVQQDLYAVCETGAGEIVVAGERGLLLVLAPGHPGWSRSAPLGAFHGTDWLGLACGARTIRAVGSNGAVLIPSLNPSPHQ